MGALHLPQTFSFTSILEAVVITAFKAVSYGRPSVLYISEKDSFETSDPLVDSKPHYDRQTHIKKKWFSNPSPSQKRRHNSYEQTLLLSSNEGLFPNSNVHQKCAPKKGADEDIQRITRSKRPRITNPTK